MRKPYFSCFQGIIKQNKLYAVTCACAAVWRVDFGRRKAEVIRWLDESSALSHREYATVCQMGDSIVLIPAKSDSVVFYDFKKDTLSYTKIVQPKIKTREIYNQEKKFWGGFTSHDSLYLLGASYPAIMKINADGVQTSYLDDWVEEIQDLIPENDTSFYFAHSYIMDGETVYIPGRASGVMLGLNLLTDQVTVYKINSSVKMLHGIICCGEKKWVLASMNDRESLFSWSPEDGFTDEIIIETHQTEDLYWWGPVESDGYIYLFQMNGNAVFRVNAQEKIIEPCAEVTNAIGDIPNPISRYSVCLIGEEKGKIYFLTLWNRKWFIYHTKDRSIESFGIEIVNEEYERRYWNELKGKSFIRESELPLRDFLEIFEGSDMCWNDWKNKY